MCNFIWSTMILQSQQHWYCNRIHSLRNSWISPKRTPNPCNRPNNATLQTSHAQTIDLHANPRSTVAKRTRSFLLISFHLLHCAQCLLSLSNINRSFAEWSVLANKNNHYKTSSMFKINNPSGLHCLKTKFQIFWWQRVARDCEKYRYKL